MWKIFKRERSCEKVWKLCVCLVAPGIPLLCQVCIKTFCLFVSAVHFAPYLTGLSSMMLIWAAGARCKWRAHLHNRVPWQRLELQTFQSLGKHSNTELSCYPLKRCLVLFSTKLVPVSLYVLAIPFWWQIFNLSVCKKKGVTLSFSQLSWLNRFLSRRDSTQYRSWYWLLFVEPFALFFLTFD